MHFRSSSLVVSALLIAGGGCILLAPVTQAGEHLDFSTPAFPLAVPHPAVEAKETKKPTASESINGVMVAPDIAPQGVVISRPRHRDQDAWDSNPLLGEDQNKRSFDDWITGPPEPNLSTNGSNLNMPRGWDAKDSQDPQRRRNDSGLEANQNASRFGSSIGLDGENKRDEDRNASRYGSPIGFDGENKRDGDRYGRDSYSDKDNLSFFKMFGHESSDKDKFTGARYTPFRDETATVEGAARESRMREMKASLDSVPNSSLPSDFGSYTPFDNSQSRLTANQMEAQSGIDHSMRAWEPPASIDHLPVARGNLNLGQNIPSRVVAPNRPINLPFPKRPGDF
jgi:hypothetical protein